MKEEVDRSRRSVLWIAPLGGIALSMPAVLQGQKKGSRRRRGRGHSH